jgi:hypothetical protein
VTALAIEMLGAPWLAMLAPQFAACFIGSREAHNLSSRLAMWAGEFRHRIAVSLDMNPGRISDVIKKRIHAGSRGRALLKNPAA